MKRRPFAMVALLLLVTASCDSESDGPGPEPNTEVVANQLETILQILLEDRTRLRDAVTSGRHAPAPSVPQLPIVGAREGEPRPETTIVATGGRSFHLSSDDVGRIDDQLPCGADGAIRVFCPGGSSTLEAGVHTIAWLRLATDFPLETDLFYQFGLARRVDARRHARPRRRPIRRRRDHPRRLRSRLTEARLAQPLQLTS